MSHDTENKQCQICNGYLFEDDDVVICPECGAPHHRDCWQTVGHCGVEADHGTERQYDRQKATEAEQSDDNTEERVCRFCKKSSKTAEGKFCPYCGKSYSSEANPSYGPMGGNPHIFVGGMPFPTDSYGGVPKDSRIEDVKVEHIAKFVGSNAHRYVPKFSALTKKKKASWNWAAALFPSAWCFARKMYLTGLMYLIIEIAAGLSMIPFAMFAEGFYVEGMTEVQLYTEAFNHIAQIDLWTGVLLGVGMVLSIAPSIVCGITADWVYRGFTLEKVRKITKDPEVEDVDQALMRSGSLNLFLMILIFYAGQYLPSIIGSLIW